METEKTDAGILFADISDSSHLFKAYGNEGARDVILECIGIMRAVVGATSGRVVERIGDELLTAFPTPDAALLTAIDLQMAIAESRGQSLPDFLAIRIGFHFGEVLVQGEGLFGDTIYTANRVCALAKGNEILTTGQTVARLAPELQEKASFIEKRTLKGAHQVHDIFQVWWDDPQRTATPEPEETGDDLERDIFLELTLLDHRIVLSPSNPVCVVGRSERCDLQVIGQDVSRVHARIEYRDGYFVVVDLSSNGTTVRLSDGRQTTLHRKELRLDGSGEVRVSSDQPAEIRYECVARGDDEPGSSTPA